MEESDLPLPSDRRAATSRVLAPLRGALAEKLEELRQSQLPEEQLIQFHRMAFGALAALIAIQAAAPTAVPSLWWAFISQPLLLRFPSNVLGGFWYLMGVALWLAYAAYHVTQGALLGRTRSRWPWSPPRTLGMALIPLYNVYGSWVLFSEAFTRLGRESDKPGRAAQARSALLGSLALIGATWGLQLASDLGLEIPDIAIQAAAWARAAAELATLGLAFSMMTVVIRQVADEGSWEPEEGEDLESPLSRGPSGPAPGLTGTVLVALTIAGFVIYYSRKENVECPNGASLTTRVVGQGQRALYCAKDGFPEGPWRVRTKTGGVEQFTYMRGAISGEYKAWYPDGQLKETGFLGGDKKNGIWVHYSEAGDKLDEATWSDNLLEGPSRKFHPDGKVAEERTYQGGKLWGKYRAFHENGAKAEEGQYKDGNKIGHWTSWNPSGLVVDEKDYVLGKGAPAGTGTSPGGTTGTGTTATGTGEPPVAAAAATATPPPQLLHEVTERRFFAGRTPEWWEDRLTRLKQRVETGELNARVYELTRKRAQLNGLEVMDAQSEVKVRMAVTAAAPQGGRP